MDDIDFKEEYIDRKIEGLDANKASLIEKNVFITALGIAGTLALGSAAFMFGKLVTQIAVTLALFDAVIPVVTIMTDVYRNNQLKQIEKEMKHLKTLKKQGIKSTKELDRKRLEKINEYEEQEEEISEKSGLYSILTTILTISWFISTCASLISPNAVIISIVSLLAATGVLAKSAADDKKILELEASIQNLKHNIELGSLYGYTDAKKSTNTNTKTKQKDISNEKTKSKSNNIQASKAVNLDNCELVDEYLESLERKGYNDEKAKELIKK